MENKSSIKINIPEPCRQDWVKMEQRQEGKYCAQCSKTIYDFSQMEDAELFRFLKSSPQSCGRFHHSQLKREIYEAPKPPAIHYSKFSKIAAAALTILSFKATSG